MSSIVAYKLMHLRKDGTLGPLMIDRTLVVPVGKWVHAKPRRTPGFAYRPGWHAVLNQHAPHLKKRLSSGERRVWCRVKLRDFKFHERPKSHGGLWILAKEMKVIEIIG